MSQDLARRFFKFQKLRNVLDIAQNILIVHHFDRWGWGLVMMGECSGLNLCRQQWEAACNFALCDSTITESLSIPISALHNFGLLPGQNLANYHYKALHVSASVGDVNFLWFEQRKKNMQKILMPDWTGSSPQPPDFFQRTNIHVLTPSSSIINQGPQIARFPIVNNGIKVVIRIDLYKSWQWDF